MSDLDFIEAGIQAAEQCRPIEKWLALDGCTGGLLRQRDGGIAVCSGEALKLNIETGFNHATPPKTLPVNLHTGN